MRKEPVRIRNSLFGVLAQAVSMELYPFYLAAAQRRAVAKGAVERPRSCSGAEYEWDLSPAE